MAAETIKEFLVALGFKVDQPTLKKFEDAITSSTLKADVMANAFIGMAKSLAQSLADVTRDLNNLYYTSVRVGSSATNLKALTQASQDFGVSSEEALGNIEALAQALRTDPGTEAFINHLGVRTREANGELRDTVQVANELGRVLATKPDYMAQQLAELVGLTYKFQTMIRDPGWLADLEKHRALLKDSGYEDAARDAAELEQQFRELEDRWDSLKKRSAVTIFGPIIGELEKLNTFLNQHAPEIEANIASIKEAMSTDFGIMGGVLSKSLEGWKELYTLIKDLTVFINSSFPNLASLIRNTFGLASNPFLWALDKLGLKDLFAHSIGIDGSHPDSPASVTAGIRNHNPGNLKYAGQAGAVRAGGSPSERRFASFRTDQEGLAAMARQLDIDFGRGLNNLTALLGNYAPPEENDTAAYIRDVAGKLHVGATQSLNLNDPTVLANLMNAMILHEQGQNPYRATDVRAAAQQAVQSGDVHMTQTNTININGAQDPAKTKQAVSDALYDSYSRMTRNLQPTTQ